MCQFAVIPHCFPQPLRLDIKRKLTARSDRVKSVDLHPTEPWMLASLYNGSVCVWNHETQVMALAVPYWEMCITDTCVSAVGKLNLYRAQ